MELKVVGTGSSGNNYLLTDDQGRTIALDLGLPITQVLRALNWDVSTLDGCLLSHGHGDHSKSAKDMLNRGIPVYMSQGTSEALGGIGDILKHGIMTEYAKFTVGNWRVLPFAVEHDAPEPVGFLLSQGPYKVLYATDTYFLKYKFTGLTSIIVECNYCNEILAQNIEAGKLPVALKNRLLHSHFSLENVKKFLAACDLSKCVKIVLVHLSDGNSNQEQMEREISKQTGIETIAAEAGMTIDFNLFPF